jgi:hypothetical protein
MTTLTKRLPTLTISPAQLTANTNDWGPTDLYRAKVVRVSTDASRNLTGIVAQSPGRLVVLVNVGSNDLVLKDADTNSSAANRFALNGDVTLGADHSVLLVYDGGSTRWRCVARYDAGAGGSTPEFLFKVLGANDTGGQNVNTAQPWFPTNGAVAVSASKAYRFWGHLRTSRSAGTNAHTTAILFGGTATLTGIGGRAWGKNGDVATLTAEASVPFEVATATVVKASSTSGTEQTSIFVEGVVRINAGGTFIPQFQYSAAPGGAPTVLANSCFFLEEIGVNTVTEEGTWT